MDSNTQPVKLFVVIDPVQQRHLALERALVTAKMRQPQASIHLFIGLDMDVNDTSADNEALYKDLEWFQTLVAPIKNAGIEYSAQMSWSSDWYSAIKKTAQQQQADLIMLPLDQTPTVNRRLFSDSVWRLMRTAHSPVLMIRNEVEQQRKVILAAVKFQGHEPEYEALNVAIIERAKWYAEIYQCELHLVNTYEDSINFPDRAHIIEQSGVPNGSIHVINGKPEDAILNLAKELKADVTLLGLRKRANRWRGNTADRLVSRISGDLLVLN